MEENNYVIQPEDNAASATTLEYAVLIMENLKQCEREELTSQR